MGTSVRPPPQNAQHGTSSVAVLLFRVSQALHSEKRYSGMGHDAARAFGFGKLVAGAYQNIAVSSQIGESRKSTGRCFWGA